MKIYVHYDTDDHNMIRGVETLGFYLDKGKTEEQIDEAMQKRNQECGWDIFRAFEIDDELEKVIRFFLGEKEYKRIADITHVYERLKDIKDDVESMRDDTFHMSEFLESTIEDVEKLIPEEDRW